MDTSAHNQPTERSDAETLAAALLRDEYLTALYLGDPRVEVSTPGFAVDHCPLIELVMSLADQQAALLAHQGAL